MQILHTIEEIQKVFPTAGSNPLLVTCNDFEDWVCKYDRSSLNLFNELLANRFAKVWGIKTPEIALIKVNKDHVPIEKYPRMQPNLFNKECFGSFYLKNSKEVDSSLVSLFTDSSFKRKFHDKEDFLKIALFDIWLANEDRNHNNFNLLLYASPSNRISFYAIDHVNIFNGSFLDYGLTEITADESILKTELAKVLFGKSKKLVNLVNNLMENFYLCIKECEDNLDEIIALIPDSWDIDKEEIRDKIIRNLFNEEWSAVCERNFREFIQSFILN